ncbi:uncharacterized protein LOC124569287 [Schistocerca americana]|uniref:uncharacterized protein LOC124569287 n=1 Tax=Schistocerca americana TaxID=7009 RepID=UPI001F4FF8E0|nr:uncharacterized protein LOC124569287 [Schistocerca americana]
MHIMLHDDFRFVYQCLSLRMFMFDFIASLALFQNARKEKLAVIGSKVRAVLPNATDEDCKTRFMSLRSHFCGELKKIRASEHSGAGASEVYEPAVWWFSALKFLKDYVTPRKTVTNIPSRMIPQSLSSNPSSTTTVNDPCNTEVTTVTEETIVNDGYIEDDNSSYSQDIFTVELSDGSTPVSTPSPLSEQPYASARKRHRKETEDELATSTLSVLRDIRVSISGSNEDDKFGQYVAAELKKFKNPAIKADVKLNVMKCIMDGIHKEICN